MPCARRTGFGSPVLSEQPPSRGLMYAVARYAHSDGTEIQTRTRSLSFGSPFLAGIAGGLDASLTYTSVRSTIQDAVDRER